MKRRYKRGLAGALGISVLFTSLPVGASVAEEIPVIAQDAVETAEGDTEGIAIDAAHFSDESFRKYVKEVLDLDGDGILSVQEKNIEALDISSQNISDLTGLSEFPNLRSLNCSQNQLHFLDISQNPLLKQLICSGNQLGKLDLSSNPELEEVVCENNLLTELKLGGLSHLVSLKCSDNSLKELDLESFSSLETLECAGNLFDVLTLPKQSALKYLDCSRNAIYSVVNLNNQPLLETLDVSGDNLKLLDVSNSPGLTSLTCEYSGLYFISLPQNLNLTQFNAQYLSCVYPGSMLKLGTMPGFQAEALHDLENAKFADGILKPMDLKKPVQYQYDIETANGIQTVSYYVFFNGGLDEELFPDPGFYDYIVKNCDWDQNGTVTMEDLAQIMDLNVSYLGIRDLTGLEYFSSLTFLNCSNNKLTKLDVSKNKQLTGLNCSDNQLKTVNVGMLPRLSMLECCENPLTQLALSKNTELTYLDVRDAELKTLDLSANKKLQTLDCRFNKLTSTSLKKPASVTKLLMAPQKEYLDVEVTNGYLPFRSLDGFEPNYENIQIEVTEGGKLSSDKQGIQLSSSKETSSVSFTVKNVFGDEVLGQCHITVNNKKTSVTPQTPKLIKISSSFQNRIYWERSENATGYRVYRKAVGQSKWTKLADVGEEVSYYTDAKAILKQPYLYTVRAKNTVEGKTLWSKYDKKGLQATAKLAVTRLKKAEAISYDQIQVEWEKTAGATGYLIFRKTKKGGWKRLATVGRTVLTYKDPTPDMGTEYTYTVRAIRKLGGKKYYGNYQPAGVKATAKLAAGFLLSTTTESGKQTIQWKTVDGATGYQLQYCEQPDGPFRNLAVSAKPQYTYSVTGAQADRYYRVRAYRVVDAASNKKFYGAFSKAKSRAEIEGNGTGISLNADKLNVPAGGFRNLAATVTPSDAAAGKIKWSSSDKSVAKVTQKGKVTGVSPGKATIRAEYGNGIAASCEVQVYGIATGKSYDFSELHMAGATSDQSDWGFDREISEGGTSMMATAYLARWDGTVEESRDPYPEYDWETAYHPMAADHHVQEVLFLPARQSDLDNDEIKKAVMNYGAVTASYHSDKGYYNEGDSNYYYPLYPTDSGLGGGPHDVAIVGWDDNYPKESFRECPPGDGAFICKNSWGEYSGENGYFYVSYYDCLFARKDSMAVFTDLESAQNYGSIFQYDPLGATTTLSYNQDLYQTNVFPREGEQLKSSDSLQAVSFYTYDAGYQYEVYVVPNFTDKASLSSLGAPVQRGTMEYAGYHTVTLDTPVRLAAHSRFAVVVKLSSDGKTFGYFEAPVQGQSSKATAGKNESFVSQNGTSWWDINDNMDNTNACVKAFLAGDGAVEKTAHQEEAVQSPISQDGYTPEELMEMGFQVNPEFIESKDDPLQMPVSTAPVGEESTGAAELTFPEYYDLRQQGRVTSVKNQGNLGLCWAFAAYASLESNALK